jgi:Domain of unknown function (DUF4124)
MKFAMPFLCVIFFLFQMSSWAQTYQWVDKEGTVHLTDNPAELPEPYRTKALNELKEKRKETKQKSSPTDDLGTLPDVSNEKLPQTPREVPAISAPDTPVAPYRSSLESDNAAKKKVWKEKVKQARDEVTNLTALCDSLRSQLGEAMNAKAVFSRPSDIARAEKADADLKQCEQNLDSARRYLEEDLPDEARRSGVPPGWLRQ